MIYMLLFHQVAELLVKLTILYNSLWTAQFRHWQCQFWGIKIKQQLFAETRGCCSAHSKTCSLKCPVYIFHHMAFRQNTAHEIYILLCSVWFFFFCSFLREHFTFNLKVKKKVKLNFDGNQTMFCQIAHETLPQCQYIIIHTCLFANISFCISSCFMYNCLKRLTKPLFCKTSIVKSMERLYLCEQLLQTVNLLSETCDQMST